MMVGQCEEREVPSDEHECCEAVDSSEGGEVGDVVDEGVCGHVF